MPEISTTASESSDAPRWFWAIFFTLTVFVYLFGLTIPFVGPDEPRYAEVAREMFQRGDWVTPTLGGFNWFEKPALLYWLEIVSYHVFGINEFAARLGPAVCGLGTVAALWLIGRYAGLESKFANLLALVAASTLGIIVFSRGASFDIVVTFPITASLAGFIIYDTERNHRLAIFCFYFFIGVALLAKGLIGLVFPFGIVAFYFLVTRKWPDRGLLLSALWGIPLIALVAAVWYVPMYLRHGDNFINEFIIQQHFQRFTSNKYQHPQPFFFFLWVLPLMTIPWLPFFLFGCRDHLASLVNKIRSAGPKPERSSDSSKRLAAFAWAWLSVPLLFFCFSGSKLPGYILPSVPPAVLIAALQIYRFLGREPKRFRLIQAVAIATYVTVVIALIFFVPSFLRHETVKDLVATANSKGYRNLQVTGFITVSHNAEFYAAGRLVRDDDGKQHRFVGVPELREYIDAHGGNPLLVFSPLEYVQHLTNSDLVHTDVLDDNGELAITVVRPIYNDQGLIAARRSRSINAVPIPVSGTDSQ
jgi:4-amino-4-deoxy-L-arabinose transferase-like glycosyltransferase